MPNPTDTSRAAGYREIAIGGGDTGQPRNLQKRLAVIARFGPLSGKRVLDCGCGEGAYVRALLEQGADAEGIEYSAAKVAAFRRLGHEPARVQEGDLEKLPHPTATYDFALLNEVLEHVPDDARAVTEVHRVLKPGGLLAVFAPNRLFPFETHGITLRRSGRSLPPYFPGIPYVPLWLGRRWFRFHARNYLPSELRHLLVRAGFQIVHRTWLWQTFENISGRQPAFIRWALPLFRGVAHACERLPLIRCCGVSQVWIARKP